MNYKLFNKKYIRNLTMQNVFDRMSEKINNLNYEK